MNVLSVRADTLGDVATAAKQLKQNRALKLGKAPDQMVVLVGTIKKKPVDMKSAELLVKMASGWQSGYKGKDKKIVDQLAKLKQSTARVWEDAKKRLRTIDPIAGANYDIKNANAEIKRLTDETKKIDGQIKTAKGAQKTNLQKMRKAKQAELAQQNRLLAQANSALAKAKKPTPKAPVIAGPLPVVPVSPTPAVTPVERPVAPTPAPQPAPEPAAKATAIPVEAPVVAPAPTPSGAPVPVPPPPPPGFGRVLPVTPTPAPQPVPAPAPMPSAVPAVVPAVAPTPSGAPVPPPPPPLPPSFAKGAVPVPAPVPAPAPKPIPVPVAAPVVAPTPVPMPSGAPVPPPPPPPPGYPGFVPAPVPVVAPTPSGAAPVPPPPPPPLPPSFAQRTVPLPVPAPVPAPPPPGFGTATPAILRVVTTPSNLSSVPRDAYADAVAANDVEKQNEILGKTLAYIVSAASGKNASERAEVDSDLNQVLEQFVKNKIIKVSGLEVTLETDAIKKLGSVEPGTLKAVLRIVNLKAPVSKTLTEKEATDFVKAYNNLSLKNRGESIRAIIGILSQQPGSIAQNMSKLNPQQVGLVKSEMALLKGAASSAKPSISMAELTARLAQRKAKQETA